LGLNNFIKTPETGLSKTNVKSKKAFLSLILMILLSNIMILLYKLSDFLIETLASDEREIRI